MDTNVINMDVLKNCQTSLNNEANNFKHVTYSSFKSSYLNNCGDSYIRRMASNLNILYGKIDNGYNSINKWWSDYNTNAIGLETALSSEGKSGNIKEANISSYVNNNLGALANYQNTLAEKNAVDLNHIVYTSALNETFLLQPVANTNATIGEQYVSSIDANIPNNIYTQHMPHEISSYFVNTNYASAINNTGATLAVKAEVANVVKEGTRVKSKIEEFFYSANSKVISVAEETESSLVNLIEKWFNPNKPRLADISSFTYLDNIDEEAKQEFQETLTKCQESLDLCTKTVNALSNTVDKYDELYKEYSLRYSEYYSLKLMFESDGKEYGYDDPELWRDKLETFQRANLTNYELILSELYEQYKTELKALGYNSWEEVDIGSFLTNHERNKDALSENNKNIKKLNTVLSQMLYEYVKFNSDFETASDFSQYLDLPSLPVPDDISFETYNPIALAYYHYQDPNYKLNQAYGFLLTNSMYYVPYMSEEQIKIYNCLYAKEGYAEAEAYFSTIKEDLNYLIGCVQASEFLEKYNNTTNPIDKAAMLFAEGVFDGMDNFMRGLGNFVNPQSILSEGEYKQMVIMQALTSELLDEELKAALKDPAYTEEKFKELCEKKGFNDSALVKELAQYGLGDQILSYVYKFGITTGNMLPTIAVSSLSGCFGLSEKVIKLIGGLTMGASSAGNATHDALVRGVDPTKARWYGLLTGFSEAFMQVSIGNLPGINPNALLGIKEVLGESAEEMLQNVVGVYLNAIICGEPVEFDLASIAEDGIFGLAMSASTCGVKSVITEINGIRVEVSVDALTDLINSHYDNQNANTGSLVEKFKNEILAPKLDKVPSNGEFTTNKTTPSAYDFVQAGAMNPFDIYKQKSTLSRALNIDIDTNDVGQYDFLTGGFKHKDTQNINQNLEDSPSYPNGNDFVEDGLTYNMFTGRFEPDNPEFFEPNKDAELSQLPSYDEELSDIIRIQKSSGIDVLSKTEINKTIENFVANTKLIDSESTINKKDDSFYSFIKENKYNLRRTYAEKNLGLDFNNLPDAVKYTPVQGMNSNMANYIYEHGTTLFQEVCMADLVGSITADGGTFLSKLMEDRRYEDVAYNHMLTNGSESLRNFFKDAVVGTPAKGGNGVVELVELDGKYYVGEDGNHRMVTLKLEYLNEISKATSPDKIADINKKYTFTLPVVSTDHPVNSGTNIEITREQTIEVINSDNKVAPSNGLLNGEPIAQIDSIDNHSNLWEENRGWLEKQLQTKFENVFPERIGKIDMSEPGWSDNIIKFLSPNEYKAMFPNDYSSAAKFKGNVCYVNVTPTDSSSTAAYTNVIHELAHKISENGVTILNDGSVNINGKNYEYSKLFVKKDGFSTTYFVTDLTGKESRIDINNGLNESVTEYYTKKMAGEDYANESGYTVGVQALDKLVTIFGDDSFLDGYATSDLSTFRDKYNSYLNNAVASFDSDVALSYLEKHSFDNFIKDFDILTTADFQQAVPHIKEVFSLFENAKNKFYADANASAMAEEGFFDFSKKDKSQNNGLSSKKLSQLTEQQIKDVNEINTRIRKGESGFTMIYSNTTKLSSAMLNSISDLSKVSFVIIDGLGDANGRLKAKYNGDNYMSRITYSGYETQAIIGKIEELQSLIDINLPIKDRAKQIYDILATEIPTMRDHSTIENGTKVAQSLRGITPLNDVGKSGLICAGYSSLFKELCDRVGLKSDYIRGDAYIPASKSDIDNYKRNASNGDKNAIRKLETLKTLNDGLQYWEGKHAWNIVETGNGIIPIDVTWKASGVQEWFGPSTEFARTHVSDMYEESYHVFDEPLRPDNASPAQLIKYNPANPMQTLKQIVDSHEQSRPGEGMLALKKFINTERDTVITRTNGARDALVTIPITEIERYIAIDDAIKVAMVNHDAKYGYGSSIAQLQALVDEGNFNRITSANGARESLQRFSIQELRAYLEVNPLSHYLADGSEASLSSKFNDFINNLLEKNKKTEIIKNDINKIYSEFDEFLMLYTDMGGIDQASLKKLDTARFKESIDAKSAIHDMMNYITLKYNMSKRDFYIILNGLNNLGACTYATVAGIIIDKFKYDPNLFESTFGFPLYRTLASGTQIINQELLIMDLYIFANQRGTGGKLFTYNIDVTINGKPATVQSFTRDNIIDGSLTTKDVIGQKYATQDYRFQIYYSGLSIEKNIVRIGYNDESYDINRPINIDGQEVMINVDMVIATDAVGTGSNDPILVPDDQQYLFVKNIDDDLINRYLAQRGAFQIQSNIIFESVQYEKKGMNNSFKDKLQQIIETSIQESNKSICLGLSTLNTDIRFIDINGMPRSIMTLDNPGGHALNIIGVDPAGIIVSTWGNKYLIPYEDLFQSRFYIHESIISQR